MRLAWLGPAPREDHGVPAVATLLLRSLVNEGLEIDCFTSAPREELPDSLLTLAGLRWVLQETPWRWDRWYSRTATSAYLTSRATRAASGLRLGNSLRRHHATRPYDLVYLFSAPDSFSLGRHLSALPPLVLHPQVHAAGELRWHRREEQLAARGESEPRRLAVRSMLAARARAQRRALARARRIICPSERFAQLLTEDYGIPSAVRRIVPNPVDLERFSPSTPRRASGEPIRLIFVGMLAVRKGVEMVVELSHRLADQAGTVTIEVAGEPRGWSDYSALLKDLHPDIARTIGRVEPDRIPALYRSADALLAPSHYEPFGLSVAEALACGVAVVASDQVGAAEFVQASTCRTFPAGDMDAFEAATRAMLNEIATNRAGLGNAARSAAAAFSPQRIGAQLASALAEVAER